MQEKIAEIKALLSEKIKAVKDERQINDLRVEFLGKTGLVSSLMKFLRDVEPQNRPAVGKLINDLREFAETLVEKIANSLKSQALIKRYEDEKVDITLPPDYLSFGTLHPITLIKNQIIDIFASMGFMVFEGPEIETDYYSFQALNLPKDHPARDMQDTFYITENILLRPHTSPGQIRVMENQKPPIKILCPGRVYRSDDDATHSPMFHQIEGLVVDKNITLCDLKGMLTVFGEKMFGDGTKTRLRPSYFPFTEPSVEVDVTCSECRGAGCRLCKGTGWIEILGAGMVNRKVLENCNVNPDEFSGFAFGLGIDRIAMLKYKIPDMRLLFENDIRFLKQFSK